MLKVQRFLLPVAVFALICTGCGSGGLGGSVSLDEEWQLGQQMAAQVNQQVSLVHDQLAAQILAGGAMARFSRADEKQADDMGLDLMTRAGYDPHGMLDMFQKLLSMERSGSSSVARFFQDHPGTQDRIDDISGRVSRMGRTSGIVDDPEYRVTRRRMGG